MEYLMKFDLSSVDLRTIPTTMALLDQKLSSLDIERGWWLDVLTRGELPWGCDIPGECPAYRLFDRYIKHAGRQGARRRAIETRIGMFLTKQVPDLKRHLRTYKRWTNLGKIADKVGKVLTFPPLSECREAFAKTTGQNVDWDTQIIWTVEASPDQEDQDTAHIEDGADIPF